MKLFTPGATYSYRSFASFVAFFLILHFSASATFRHSGITPPSATAACPGDSASFTSTDSLIAGTIQWQVSIDSGISYSDITGATDTTYRFAASPYENGFMYRAVFADGVSTDTSAAAMLTVYPYAADTITTAICPGQDYMIGSDTFTTAGTYFYTFSGASVHGCDSLVYLYLSVYSPAADTISTMICPGDSFVVSTQAYYTSGTFIDTLHGGSGHGCDSIVVLHLSIYAPALDTIAAEICSGDSFVFHTQAYYSTGTYYDTLHGAAIHGCDSIVAIQLHTFSPATKNIHATICQGSYYIVSADTFRSAGTFIDTLRGRAVHGCDSTVTLYLTVDQLVTPSITIAANTGDTICRNTVVNLFAVGINGGNNPDYQWKRNGINVGNSQTYVANPIADGDIYSCVLTSTATCATPSHATSDSITFTVDAYPAVTISSSAGSSVCTGDSLLLTASGGQSYAWSTGATSPSIYTAGGTYTVTATNVYGCTAGAAPLTISPGHSLTDSVTQIGDTLVSAPSQFYQWYMDSTIISGATGPVYIPAHSGDYQVAVIDSFGCRTYSAVVYIQETGISTVATGPALSIYPNPGTGLFTLRCTDQTPRMVTILDALGRVVCEHITVVHQQQFDLRTATDGIYYMQITNGNNINTLKFSLVR
jgi:hypothetical protein